jgi:uncharacterized protein (TIGR02598 family)
MHVNSNPIQTFIKPAPCKREAGFSLPEVAIAVAVAALGIVSLLGIIPGGLSSIRTAGELTSAARIASQVVGEIQLSDWGRLDENGAVPTWSNLEELLKKRWLYDDQANPIDDPKARGQEFRLAYVVRVRSNDAEMLLPGVAVNNRNMKGLLVDVALASDPNYSFSDPRLYRTFPAILTRQFSNG